VGEKLSATFAIGTSRAYHSSLFFIQKTAKLVATPESFLDGEVINETL
jgi:hypothetical protein